MTLRRVLTIVGAWALLVAALLFSHSRPAIAVLGGIVAAIAATLFAALDLADVVSEVDWTPDARHRISGRRGDARVSWTRQKVQSARWSGSTEIVDTLTELIDDRLLAHHHIDRATDPTAAATVLTPGLRSFLDGRRRPAMTTRELQRVLTEIEAL